MTYYIRTVVTLKMGGLPAYSAMMSELAPFMARHGWVLQTALQPMVGDLTEVIHIWEVEAFADIARGMEACGSDPEAHAILAPMPDLVHTEVVQVMTKTSYSP